MSEPQGERRARLAKALSPTTESQRRALGVMALLAVVAMLWMAIPVGTGLLLGVLVGFSLQPLDERLRRKLSPRPAALVCSIGATTVIGASVALFGYAIAVRGVSVLVAAPSLLAEGGGLRRALDRLAVYLSVFHVSSQDLMGKLQAQVNDLESDAASVAADAIGLTMHGLLTLFFLGITTYFVVSHWERMARRAEIVLPLHPRHTRALLAELREVGRHVFVGTLFTGLAQGLLAALGYWACGAPQPAFFGAITAAASLVPGVGTVLVWLPMAAYLLAGGHTVGGVALIIYGALVVVGASDYVIRPKLVGDNATVPALFTFVALFGGVEALGLVGLVLGPLLVTFAIALLRTYYEERKQEAHPEARATPLLPLPPDEARPAVPSRPPSEPPKSARRSLPPEPATAK